MPAYPTIRTLVGESLYLRPSLSEDIAGSHQWLLHSDPYFLSAMSGGLMTAAEAVEALKKSERGSQQQFFTGVRKQDNLPVGRCSYRVLHPLTDIADIDLLVDPDARRKGMGSEMLGLLTNLLFRSLAVHRLQTTVISLNAPAIALLEKSGFKREGILRSAHFYNGRYHDAYLYGMLAFESGRSADDLPLPFGFGG